MFSLRITDAQTDEYAAQLVTEVCDAITPQWKLLFPAVHVVLTREPLSQIPTLQEFWSAQTLPIDECQNLQVICPEFDASEATLWVRYDGASIMNPREYYFKKELYQMLAQLLWMVSADIREFMKNHGIGNRTVQYLVFRDTFSRFFLNPDWLQERKPTAWLILSSIDKKLRQTA